MHMWEAPLARQMRPWAAVASYTDQQLAWDGLPRIGGTMTEETQRPARRRHHPRTLVTALMLLGAVVGGVALTHGPGSGTSTSIGAPAPTATRFSTATASAPSAYPYRSLAPGPGCDTGGATWFASPGASGASPGADVTCIGGHTRLTAVNPGCGGCGWTTGVVWDVGTADQAVWRLSNFVMRVDFDNLSTNASVDITVTLATPGLGQDYRVELDLRQLSNADFAYEASTSYFKKDGVITLTASAPHELTLWRRGVLATFEVDGSVLASGNISSMADVDSVTLGVLSGSYTPASVDLFNFEVEAIP